MHDTHSSLIEKYTVHCTVIKKLKVYFKVAPMCTVFEMLIETTTRMLQQFRKLQLLHSRKLQNVRKFYNAESCNIYKSYVLQKFNLQHLRMFYIAENSDERRRGTNLVTTWNRTRGGRTHQLTARNKHLLI